VCRATKVLAVQEAKITARVTELRVQHANPSLPAHLGKVGALGLQDTAAKHALATAPDRTSPDVKLAPARPPDNLQRASVPKNLRSSPPAATQVCSLTCAKR
jgi:hypothetical protein